MIEPRIGDYIHDLRSVSQAVQLIERQEAHARVIRLGAKNAVQLDGVADGFMDLQGKLAAIENQIEISLPGRDRLCAARLLLRPCAAHVGASAIRRSAHSP